MTASSKRVLVVFGTRPEAIKMAPVIEAIRRVPGLEPIPCVTAQHRQMLDQMLALFEIQPQHDLNLMRADQTLAGLTARVVEGMGQVLLKAAPDYVLVQGDTTTTMATALAAFYAGVPVGHVEAGLRTDDIRSPWPEEMNRRVATILADLHFAPTEWSCANLVREGVDPGRIRVTGNTVIDSLMGIRQRIMVRDPRILSQIEDAEAILDPTRRTVLVTSHRRENFANGLTGICEAVRRVAARGDVQVVFSVHPNPNVMEPVQRMLGATPHVRLIPPQDYVSFVTLLLHSRLVLSDSGGIQEEAPSLGIPVLVLRENTERPEALNAGTGFLVGTDAKCIEAEATRLLDDDMFYRTVARKVNPFGDGRAAERIAAAVAEALDISSQTDPLPCNADLSDFRDRSVMLVL